MHQPQKGQQLLFGAFLWFALPSFDTSVFCLLPLHDIQGTATSIKIHSWLLLWTIVTLAQVIIIIWYLLWLLDFSAEGWCSYFSSYPLLRDTWTIPDSPATWARPWCQVSPRHEIATSLPKAERFLKIVPTPLTTKGSWSLCILTCSTFTILLSKGNTTSIKNHPWILCHIRAIALQVLVSQYGHITLD